MFGWDTTLMFITASALLALAPGPDNIFVLSQSALFGPRAGFIVTLGLCTGLIVHTTVVSAGVAVIFQTSPLAFNILKYCGALYLLYLAWQSFRSTPDGMESGSGTGLTSAMLYRRGIIMNVTNPKVSIFFMAFLPQFASPGNAPMALQLALLGVMFIAVTLVVFGLISRLAGMIGGWFRESPRGRAVLNRIAGAVFVALAIKLALTAQGS